MTGEVEPRERWQRGPVRVVWGRQSSVLAIEIDVPPGGTLRIESRWPRLGTRGPFTLHVQAQVRSAGAGDFYRMTYGNEPHWLTRGQLRALAHGLDGAERLFGRVQKPIADLVREFSLQITNTLLEVRAMAAH